MMALARRVAKQQIARQAAMTPDAASVAVDAVSDAEIAAAAASGGRIGALGDGGILRWLADNKDGIKELVEIIVQIALAFA
jgi:hypothetical protein